MMTAEQVAIFVVGFVLGIVAGGFIVLAAPQRGYIPTVPEDVEINALLGAIDP